MKRREALTLPVVAAVWLMAGGSDTSARKTVVTIDGIPIVICANCSGVNYQISYHRPHDWRRNGGRVDVVTRMQFTDVPNGFTWRMQERCVYGKRIAVHVGDSQIGTSNRIASVYCQNIGPDKNNLQLELRSECWVHRDTHA